jgi:hypothetical protein
VTRLWASPTSTTAGNLRYSRVLKFFSRRWHRGRPLDSLTWTLLIIILSRELRRMTAEGFCRICTNSYVYSAIVEGGVELQACRSSAASLPLSSFSHWNERNNHGDDNATIVCQLGGQRVPQQLIRTTRRNCIRVSRHQLTAMLQSKSPWSKSMATITLLSSANWVANAYRNN